MDDPAIPSAEEQRGHAEGNAEQLLNAERARVAAALRAATGHQRVIPGPLSPALTAELRAKGYTVRPHSEEASVPTTTISWGPGAPELLKEG